MEPIVFQHGPVRVTVEGLPDTMHDRAIEVNVILHSTWWDDPPCEFAATFAQLGGTDTFPIIDPEAKYADRVAPGIRADGTPTGIVGRLVLHAPETRTIKPADVIVATLAEEARR